MAILGIVFASLFRGAIFAVHLRATTENRLDAISYLDREAEYLRSLDWSSLTALATDSSFWTTPDDPKLSGTRRFADPDVNLRTVRLSVQWNDADGKTREEVVITAFAKGGLSS